MTWNVWQHFVEQNGKPLPGANIEVRKMSDNSIALLASDAVGTHLDNPFTADGDGFVRFYAEAGKYKITASSGANTFAFVGVAIGEAASRDVGTGANDVLDKTTGDALYASIRKYNVDDTAPTVNDDISQGYTNGSQWFRPASGELHQLFDETATAADWRLIDTGLTNLGTMAVKNEGAGADEFRNNQDAEDYFASQTQLTATQAALQSSIDGKVTDAPTDSKKYARRNAEWVEIQDLEFPMWNVPAGETVTTALLEAIAGTSGANIANTETEQTVTGTAEDTQAFIMLPILTDVLEVGGDKVGASLKQTGSLQVMQGGFADNQPFTASPTWLLGFSLAYDSGEDETIFRAGDIASMFGDTVTEVIVPGNVSDVAYTFAISCVANAGTPSNVDALVEIIRTSDGVVMCSRTVANIAAPPSNFTFATMVQPASGGTVGFERELDQIAAGVEQIGTSAGYAIDENAIDIDDGVYRVASLTGIARSSQGDVINGMLLAVASNVLIPVTPQSLLLSKAEAEAGYVAQEAGKGLSEEDFTAALKAKLDAVEAGADVTDAANVDAAGAVMESDDPVLRADATTTGMGFVIDEDNFASNSDEKVPTQQSVKAYVDSTIVSEKSYKGGYNANTNTPNLTTPTAGVVEKGDVYDVTVAGTFFGEALEIGDSLRATIDDPAVLGDWVIVQANLTPASIKTQYESNTDTNAFTDAEKTKLAALQQLAVGEFSLDKTYSTDSTNIATMTLAKNKHYLITDTNSDSLDAPDIVFPSAASSAVGDKIKLTVMLVDDFMFTYGGYPLSSTGGTVELAAIEATGEYEFTFNDNDEWVKTDGRRTSKVISTTTYTVLKTDNNKELIFTNAAGCAVTVPAVLGIWFHCDLSQETDGDVEVSSASTSNIYGEYKLAGNGATASLISKASGGTTKLVGETKA